MKKINLEITLEKLEQDVNINITIRSTGEVVANTTTALPLESEITTTSNFPELTETTPKKKRNSKKTDNTSESTQETTDQPKRRHSGNMMDAEF